MGLPTAIMLLKVGVRTRRISRMNETLKFEVGKKYLCRDGCTIRTVIGFMSNGDIVAESELKELLRYGSKGNFLLSESRFDMVKEYKEPAKITLNVCMFETEYGDISTVFKYSHESLQDFKRRNPKLKILAVKEITITEGEGL